MGVDATTAILDALTARVARRELDDADALLAALREELYQILKPCQQPLQVDPGKFKYQLVRAELEFEEFGTVEAHCRIDMGPVTVVPYTLLAPEA